MNFIEMDLSDSESVTKNENVSPTGSVVSSDDLTENSGDCKEPSAGGEYTGCFEGKNLVISCDNY